MMKSSRHLVRAACAAALLVGIGAGIAAAQPVIVEKAMPAPIVEVVPAAPGAGYNWVPGHWAWRGGAWFWVKGHAEDEMNARADKLAREGMGELQR